METSQISTWNETTGTIRKTVFLFAIAGAAAALFSIIPTMGWLTGISSKIMIVGLVLFYFKIKDLQALAQSADAEALNKLSAGAILFAAAELIADIPAIGWVLSAVIFIIALIMMLMAYNSLKSSATFPNAEGMKLLVTATIVGLAGIAVLFIPSMYTVGRILYIVEFILIIMGWQKVAAPIAE